MAVKSSFAPGLMTHALSARGPFSPHSDSPWPSSAGVSKSEMLLASSEHLLVPTSKDAHTQANFTAPSPIAPSPINSETTEFADVDDVDDHESMPKSPETQSIQRKANSVKSPSLKVNTTRLMPASKPIRSDDDEPPASVIYAPAGFGDFNSSPESPSSRSSSQIRPQPRTGGRTDSTESIASDVTITKTAPISTTADKFYDAQVPPTPLQTSIPAAPDWVRTPRAQTRQDLGVFSRPGSSLASINEGEDYLSDLSSTDDDEQYDTRFPAFFRNADDEIKALNQALTECWTLCNTLASLSNVHRERIFSFSGKGNMQQQAWKSCWKLCQNLYNARDDVLSTDVRTTLEYCREFCQALFDVRVRDNETADSVLRVSFELNNHLFNTHDRHLPEAFRERTLDFYITLCHRLMKQKARMADEPDNLLRTCWSLAEMLFSLRQSKNEARKPDEELLGSAIQACWDLCDLFREGWSSVRPDSRQTPRPSQTTFTQAFQQARQVGMVSTDEHSNLKLHPETPTTMIDESTTDSPCEAPAPNIVVLGSSKPTAPPHSAVGTNASHQTLGKSRQTAYKWPSSNSLVSSLHAGSNTQSDAQSTMPSSLAVTTKSAEDLPLVLLKSVFVRAAILVNRGFVPATSSSSSSSTSNARSYQGHLSSLPIFVKSLPESAFGTQAWQMNLLDNYRRAVLSDNTFETLGAATDTRLILPTATDPKTSTRLRKEVARAVKGMVAGTSGWSWLKDLFRFAYGVYIEEVFRDGNPNPATAASKDVQSRDTQSRSHSMSSAGSKHDDEKNNHKTRDSHTSVSNSDIAGHRSTSKEGRIERMEERRPSQDKPSSSTTSTSRNPNRHARRGSGGSIVSNSAEKRSASVSV